jgi:hypothetical protein
LIKISAGYVTQKKKLKNPVRKYTNSTLERVLWRLFKNKKSLAMVRRPLTLDIKWRPSGKSAFVLTAITLMPAFSRRETIFWAWIAIPPKGGGKGETIQMLLLLLFNFLNF